MLKKEAKSFGDALRGLYYLFTTERHAKVHLVITIAAVVAGFIYHIALTDWMFICIAIALVIGAEAFNTAIEKLCDVLHPQQHQQIGLVKDMAAGAVLLSAVIAVIIGCIIFIPKII